MAYMNASDIQLSILTPAVPSRFLKLAWLSKRMIDLIEGGPVEHLIFADNKMRTVGEKRAALLRMAQGKYVAFVDDDDWVSEDYVSSILEAMKSDPDVITFQQTAEVNGVKRNIEFKLGNPNEAFPAAINAYADAGVVIEEPIKRNAWHVCAWKRSLAIQSRFPATNYGEDWAYAAPLCAAAKTEEHIPRVLHYYFHSTETTEAPPGS